MLWYHDEEQRAAAVATSERLAAAKGKPVRTEILPAPTFWRAEDYHQKYRLRGREDLAQHVRGLYDSEVAFVDSTLAAKLNAALAGYPVDVDDPRLSDTERAILRRVSE